MAGTIRLRLENVSIGRMREIVHEPPERHKGRRNFVRWYAKQKWAGRALARRLGVLREPPASRLPL